MKFGSFCAILLTLGKTAKLRKLVTQSYGSKVPLRETKIARLPK